MHSAECEAQNHVAGDGQNSLSTYSIAAKQWKTRIATEEEVSAREGMVAAMYDGKLYVHGGQGDTPLLASLVFHAESLFGASSRRAWRERVAHWGLGPRASRRMWQSRALVSWRCGSLGRWSVADTAVTGVVRCSGFDERHAAAARRVRPAPNPEAVGRAQTRAGS